MVSGAKSHTISAFGVITVKVYLVGLAGLVIDSGPEGYRVGVRKMRRHWWKVAVYNCKHRSFFGRACPNLVSCSRRKVYIVIEASCCSVSVVQLSAEGT